MAQKYRTQREIFISKIPDTIWYSTGPTSDVPGYLIRFENCPFEGVWLEILFDGSGYYTDTRLSDYKLIHADDETPS